MRLLGWNRLWRKHWEMLWWNSFLFPHPPVFQRCLSFTVQAESASTFILCAHITSEIQCSADVDVCWCSKKGNVSGLTSNFLNKHRVVSSVWRRKWWWWMMVWICLQLFAHILHVSLMLLLLRCREQDVLLTEEVISGYSQHWGGWGVGGLCYDETWLITDWCLCDCTQDYLIIWCCNQTKNKCLSLTLYFW